jgi:hypothetical protein
MAVLALNDAWTGPRYQPCLPVGDAGDNVTVVLGGGGAGLTTASAATVVVEPCESATCTLIGICPGDANV